MGALAATDVNHDLKPTVAGHHHSLDEYQGEGMLIWLTAAILAMALLAVCVASAMAH